MVSNTEILEKGIIEKLPQIPFVVDQVGHAMSWAKEVYDENNYYKILEFALDVAEYAAKVSEPNFFKTHLVIAALLIDIEEAEKDSKFEIFKSTSNAIEKAVQAVKVDPKLSDERGCFKAISIHAVNLAKESQEYFSVVLYNMLSDLKDIVKGMKEVNVKAPITVEDYVKVLGYSFVMQNIRLANLNLLNETREVINKIEILLNNDLNY